VGFNEDGKAFAGMGVDFADYDNDGRADVIVTDLSNERYMLFRQNADATFRDVTNASGVGGATLSFSGWSTRFFDYDNDGWLDLFITNGAVNIVEALRGQPNPFRMKNQLFRNTRDGRLADVSAESGPAFQRADVGRGAAFGDLDNDGDTDAIVAFGRLDVVVKYTAGNGASADNDEYQRFGVYLRDGEGFIESGRALALDGFGAWRGFAVADLNEDGWLDLARRDLNGPIVLDLSRCGSEAWLRVVPEPAHLAVGARVFVTAGGKTWVRNLHAGGTSLNSGGPPEVHFGLGSIDDVDEIEVRWPDGEVSTTGPTHTRQVVRISR